MWRDAATPAVRCLRPSPAMSANGLLDAAACFRALSSLELCGCLQALAPAGAAPALAVRLRGSLRELRVCDRGCDPSLAATRRGAQAALSLAAQLPGLRFVAISNAPWLHARSGWAPDGTRLPCMGALAALRSMEALELDRCTGVTAAGLPVLRHAARLTRLHLLACSRLGRDVYTKIALGAPGLAHLEAPDYGDNLVHNDMAALAALTRLTCLSCTLARDNADGAGAMAQVLSSLTRLASLSLDLRHTAGVAAGLQAALCAAPALHALALRCGELPRGDLDFLGGLSGLRSLTLDLQLRAFADGDPSLARPPLRALVRNLTLRAAPAAPCWVSELTALESLRLLDGLTISAGALARLRRLTRLQGAVANDGAGGYTAPRGLRELRVAFPQGSGTSAACWRLAGCPDRSGHASGAALLPMTSLAVPASIVDLSLEHCHVGDAALCTLGELTALSLTACPGATGTGLDGLPRLRRLRLTHCPVSTLKLLACLPKLDRLRMLELSWLGVDDSIFGLLRRLPQLQNICLAGCGITFGATRRFLLAHPPPHLLELAVDFESQAEPYMLLLTQADWAFTSLYACAAARRASANVWAIVPWRLARMV